MSVPVAPGPVVVLRAHRGGQELRHPLPTAGRIRRRAPPGGRARRGRADPPRRERAGRGPRLLRRRAPPWSAPTTAVLAYGDRHDGDERYELRFRSLRRRRAVRRRARDGGRHRLRGGLVEPVRHRLLRAGRRGHAALPAVAPPARHRSRRSTPWSFEEADDASPSVSVAPGTTRSSWSRCTAPTRPSGWPYRPTTRRPNHVSSSPAARAVEYAVDHLGPASGAAGLVRHPDQRRAPRTSGSWPPRTTAVGTADGLARDRSAPPRRARRRRRRVLERAGPQRASGGRDPGPGGATRRPATSPWAETSWPPAGSSRRARARRRPGWAPIPSPR